MQSNSPVYQFLANYKNAVFAKDIDAFCSLYAEDVCVFDAWGGPWIVRGIDALRESTKEWFDSLGNERVLVGDDEVQASVDSIHASGHGIWRFAALSQSGQELRWLENRFSVSMRKEGELWKIVHQHTSSPAEFSTMKVQLRRVVE